MSLSREIGLFLGMQHLNVYCLRVQMSFNSYAVITKSKLYVNLI